MNNTMIKIDHIAEDGTCSVLTTTFDASTFKLQHSREALAPGDLDRAKTLLPTHLLAAVQALWTPEVIAAWEAKQEREAAQ